MAIFKALKINLIVLVNFVVLCQVLVVNVLFGACACVARQLPKVNVAHRGNLTVLGLFVLVTLWSLRDISINFFGQKNKRTEEQKNRRNLYYSIVALFYIRHSLPVAEVSMYYYAPLNLLYFCTSVKKRN